MKFNGIPPEGLKFLKQLKKNNNRDWFLANKPTYESKLKQPLVELLTALQPEMKKIAPEISYEPAKSIFRIYRDIRFSSDKSPYKTNVGAYLSPKSRKAISNAGVYIHLEPGQCFIAGGLYHAMSPELLAVRGYIAENLKQFKKILDEPVFVKHFDKLKGDTLSRVPRGFPADHPAADFLKHKDFIVSAECPDQLVQSPEYGPYLLTKIRAMMPLIRFLNQGLEKTPTSIRPR